VILKGYGEIVMKEGDNEEEDDYEKDAGES
jgi:hypothetical protein